MLLYPEPWHSILARAGIRPGRLHGSALQRGRQDGAEAVFSAPSLLKLSKFGPSAVPEVDSQGLTLGNVGVHSLWPLFAFPQPQGASFSLDAHLASQQLSAVEDPRKQLRTTQSWPRLPESNLGTLAVKTTYRTNISTFSGHPLGAWLPSWPPMDA